jgi:glycerophosphoryl diester phosphodiesterase
MNKFIVLLLFLFSCLSAFAQPAAQSHYFQIEAGELPSLLQYDGTTFPIISAHRGGRYIAGYPENAIETFDYVLQHIHAIIECDVVMSQDSVLYMMHDKSLDRTTTGTGLVMNKPWAYVKELKLVDDFGKPTDFNVPTLKEVLAWTIGKTVLAIDVKRGVPFSEVVGAIEAAGAEDYVHIIVYNLKDAQTVYELNPDLMMSVSIRNEAEWQYFEASGIPAQNVVAFTGTKRSGTDLYEKLHQEGILCIQGTMGNIDRQAEANGPEVYQDLIKNGIDILATDRPLEASKAVKGLATPGTKRLKFLEE